MSGGRGLRMLADPPDDAVAVDPTADGDAALGDDRGDEAVVGGELGASAEGGLRRGPGFPLWPFW